MSFRRPKVVKPEKGCFRNKNLESEPTKSMKKSLFPGYPRQPFHRKEGKAERQETKNPQQVKKS